MPSNNSDRRRTLWPSNQGTIAEKAEGGASQTDQPQASSAQKEVSLKDNTTAENEAPSARKSETREQYLNKRHPNAIRHGSPWNNYRPFIEEQQAGPVIIAHSNDIKFDLVAIKERKSIPSEKLLKLNPAHHSNIVFLKEIYEHDGAIFTVYEYLDLSHVSLGGLRNNAGDNLNEAELAAICSQALKGLFYIHEKLKVAHGNVNAENILVAQNGMVKIANVADAMLDCSQDRSLDMRSLGDVLRHMMTSSSTWGKPILDFLEATDAADVSRLVGHIFLDFSPGPGCLVPPVQLAARNKAFHYTLTRAQ